MMVTCYGLNERLGNISFYDSTGQRYVGIQKPNSEETDRLIDEQVRKLVVEAYAYSKAILTEHNDMLMRLAESLLHKELLVKENLQNILGKRAGGESIPGAARNDVPI